MCACCVPGCTNRYSTSGRKFYRIPTGSRPFQENRRRLWLQAIQRVDWNEDIIKNARVCGAHFISGEASLEYGSPDFVPSVFVYTKKIQNHKAILERCHRKKRKDDRPIKAVNLCVPSEAIKQEGSKRRDDRPIMTANLCVPSEAIKQEGNKRRKEDIPVTTPNLCVPSEAIKQECIVDNCLAEDDTPVSRREYDDLKQRHSQLQEDYVLLCQQFDIVQAENVKLKEELQKSTCSGGC